MPELIAAFTIGADEPGSGRSKGRLHACAPLPDPGFRGRLVQHKNYRGFSYEENHLEEWIGREPSSLFGRTPVLLLASQNYVHLGVKIDLLFVDVDCRLFPTELKVVRVAKNGGIVPYDLFQRQMKQLDRSGSLEKVTHLQLQARVSRASSSNACSPVIYMRGSPGTRGSLEESSGATAGRTGQGVACLRFFRHHHGNFRGDVFMQLNGDFELA
jgi:hypothetical protein